MIDRVKKILGIEGVKMNVILSPGQQISSGRISGNLEITSISDRTIKAIYFQVVETYARGRGDYRRINDYIIGDIAITKRIKVNKDEKVILPFDIPVNLKFSEMDELSNRKMLAKPFVFAAKWIRKVSSKYSLNVKMDVVGTKLSPTLKHELEGS